MRKVHPRNPSLLVPKFAQEVFDAGRHPKAWLTVGKRLKKSAEAIFDHENVVAQRYMAEFNRILGVDPEDHAVAEFDDEAFPWPNFDGAYVLMAFAIENLLKGIMIAKGQISFSKLEIPQSLRTHDLRKLHKVAAPVATVPTHVLDVLAYMGEWRGRYPLPIRVDGFWPMNNDGTTRAGCSPSWEHFHSAFFAYFNGLEAELTLLARTSAAAP